MEEEIMKEIFTKKIGFLGVGQMGTALLLAFSKYLKNAIQKNLQNFNLSNVDDIFYLYDTQESKTLEMKNYGFKNFSFNENEIFKKSKIIFICVKPDTVEGLINRNIDYITSDTLLISIAAGVSINYLENLFIHKNPKSKINPKIIRIMTNHLCLILESASVYSVNSSCNLSDEKIVSTLLQNVGIIKKVDERQMNVFTALSGSGPAFVYQFLESLIDASLKNGVDIHIAREYAIQVLYGAAKFMKDGKEKNPNNIKYVVTTPNGTTITGLNQLDKYRFKYAVTQAITYATNRGEEIEIEKMKKFANSKF
jgi:pyrroline-5-carboxylate reductase